MSKKKNDTTEQGIIDRMLDELGEEKANEDSMCETAVPFSKRAKVLLNNEGGARTRLFDKIKTTLKSRRARHGTLSAVITAVFLVAVVLLNIIAVLINDKYPLLSVDLTSNSAYSLSDTTKDILSSLDDDIAIIILASENNCTAPDVTIDPYQLIPKAHELILRYAGYSEHISIDHVDLTRTPGILQEEFLAEYADELSDYSIIVLDQDNGRVRVTSFYDMLPGLNTDYYTADEASGEVTSSFAEAKLTSAIRTVAVERETLPAAAYVTDLAGDEQCAYFLSSLQQNGYELLEMTSNEEIPQEAEILVLPAPTKDISSWLSMKIDLWLYNDGKYGKTLISFTNPAAPVLPELGALLEGWGLKVNPTTVYEGNNDYVIAGSALSSYFYAQFTDSPYNTDLSERGKDIAVMMPNDISLLFESQNGKATEAILTSSSAGYACTDADEFEKVNGDASLAGAKVIMASSTNYSNDINGNELRSDIIVAPSTLCQSEYFNSSSYCNFSLLMTICDERTGMGSSAVDIQAKYLTDIDFSIDDGSLGAVRVIFRIIVPLALLIMGVVVYIRRRFL